MANNKLEDLNNHLFAQLERLSDEDLTLETLQKEIERSKAVNGVAKNIIENAKTTLEATKYIVNDMPQNRIVPSQFRLKE
jgi:hypothetical protein